jgi:hypothetical protein
MVVTRVREGFDATPPHAAVERDVSTNVIVVVATGTAVAAATADGVPTTAKPPTPESKRPKATTLSKKRRPAALIFRTESRPRNSV